MELGLEHWAIALAGLAPLARPAGAADHPAPAAHSFTRTAATAAKNRLLAQRVLTPTATAANIGEQVRSAVESRRRPREEKHDSGHQRQRKKIHHHACTGQRKPILPMVMPKRRPAHMVRTPAPAVAGRGGSGHPRRAGRARSHRQPAGQAAQYIRARAAALAGHEKRSRHGAPDARRTMPTATAKCTGVTKVPPDRKPGASIKPDFNVCAIGKRQSPINIEESATLQGPGRAVEVQLPALAAARW
jgi:hypothetical protein